jgi:arsenate reductase (glutaredoxin)
VDVDHEMLREMDAPYKALGLDDPLLSDEELPNGMIAHPILINRPLVVTPLGGKLCRPSKTVLCILPTPQQSAFFKEDGERVG